jgi:hypothetical protein
MSTLPRLSHSANIVSHTAESGHFPQRVPSKTVLKTGV